MCACGPINKDHKRCTIVLPIALASDFNYLNAFYKSIFSFMECDGINKFKYLIKYILEENMEIDERNNICNER